MGGLLQAYALPKALSALGLDAVQICYDYNVWNQEQRNLLVRLRKEQLLHISPFEIIQKTFQKVADWIKASERNCLASDSGYIAQCRAFEAFEKQIPHTDRVYDSDTVEQVDPLFDGFVCGSDVVWHPSRVLQTAFYLNFASQTKPRVPYAVSMGRLPYTPLEKALLKKNVQTFKTIATREQSAATFIKDLTGKPTLTVLDPTLLLTAEQWESMEDRSCLPDGKYILCYLLGDGKWPRKYIAAYAKKRRLPVVYFPYIMQNRRKADVLLHGTEICDAGPDGFVALVHHAECIFTDSFHATVFSTLFQKEFYVFDRDPGNKKTSINSRIYDFLQRYNMSDRQIHNMDEGPIAKPVPPRADVLAQIAAEREQSYEYLRKNLIEI